MMPQETWWNRFLYLGVFVVATTVLGIAARLRPDDRGYGTHRQLGLPPCGFQARTGYPCPSCGWTTAFTHVAHFQVLQAFRAQPFGALLCLATAFAGALAFAGLAFRARVMAWVERWPWPRIAGWGIFLMVAGWAYKIVVTVGNR